MRLGPVKSAMDRIAGPVVTGQVDRRHLANLARSSEAAVKRGAHAVRLALGGDVTDGTRLAPDADTDDGQGNDGEDCDLEDAETRCGPGARGGCGDLRCHDRAP